MVTIAEEFEEYREGWTAEDKKDALAYLKTVESFEFVYTLIVLQRSLMYFKEASINLQGKQQDVVSGFLLIEQCCSDLKNYMQKSVTIQHAFILTVSHLQKNQVSQ